VNTGDMEHPAKTAELVPGKYFAPDRHPVAVYLARLAPSGRRTQQQALESIAAITSRGRSDARRFPWHLLRYQHAQAIRAALAAKHRPATVNKTLAAMRGVLRECWRLDYIRAEDFHRAIDFRTVRGETLPRGRALSQGELRAVFSVCSVGRTPAGARDAAILAVLYGAGLRRSEVVALDLANYRTESHELVVKGKGRKERMAYLPRGAADALAEWLRIRGESDGPLFLPINKGGRILFRRMTAQAVYLVLSRRARDAQASGFSPHDLRRTFISDLLDAGADLATVQKLAGHSSSDTTQRYDRRGEETKRRAAELLHVPYQA